MEIVCESPKIVKQPSMLRKFVIPEESFENLSDDSKEEECIQLKNIRLHQDSSQKMADENLPQENNFFKMP